MNEIFRAVDVDGDRLAEHRRKMAEFLERVTREQARAQQQEIEMRKTMSAVFWSGITIEATLLAVKFGFLLGEEGTHLSWWWVLLPVAIPTTWVVFTVFAALVITARNRLRRLKGREA